MTTESIDRMDDRNPGYDSSDPRGVAAPPDPHAHPEAEDSLSSETYPAQRENRNWHTCNQCDREVAPSDDFCSDCSRKTFASDRSNARYGSRSLTQGARVTRDWTLDRVVAAVVANQCKHTARIAGEVALKKRVESQWETSTDTKLTLVSNFDGKVPSPIGEDYDSILDIAKASSDAGQQLLADLAADMQDQGDDAPQLYSEFGKAIDDWDTAEDLQERFGEEYWIISGVVRQRDFAFSDIDQAATAVKICKECGPAKHVYTGQDRPDDVPIGVWMCMTCGVARDSDTSDSNDHSTSDTLFEEHESHEAHMKRYWEQHGYYPFEE